MRSPDWVEPRPVGAHKAFIPRIAWVFLARLEKSKFAEANRRLQESLFFRANPGFSRFRREKPGGDRGEKKATRPISRDRPRGSEFRPPSILRTGPTRTNRPRPDPPWPGLQGWSERVFTRSREHESRRSVDRSCRRSSRPARAGGTDRSTRQREVGGNAATDASTARDATWAAGTESRERRVEEPRDRRRPRPGRST